MPIIIEDLPHEILTLSGQHIELANDGSYLFLLFDELVHCENEENLTGILKRHKLGDINNGNVSLLLEKIGRYTQTQFSLLRRIYKAICENSKLHGKRHFNIHATMLEIAGKHGRKSVVMSIYKAYFEKAKKKLWKQFFIKAIRAFSRCNEYESARKIFEEECMTNASLVAVQALYLEMAHANRVKLLQKDGYYIGEECINELYSHSRSVFRRAKIQFGQVERYLNNLMIEIAGLSFNIKHALQFFDDYPRPSSSCTETRCFDIVALIGACGRQVGMSCDASYLAAKKIYDEYKLKYRDPALYEKMLIVASRRNFDDAHRVFTEACKHLPPERNIFIVMLDCCARWNVRDVFDTVLETVKQFNFNYNFRILIKQIFCYGMFSEIGLAYTLYDSLLVRYRDESLLHLTMIEAAGRNRKFDIYPTEMKMRVQDIVND